MFTNTLHNVSVADLSDMPINEIFPFLLYSPIKVLAEYDNYQNKYSEYGTLILKQNDENFKTTLKFLIYDITYPKKDKKIFLKNIVNLLKEKTSLFHHDPDYFLHEAFSCWEKALLNNYIYHYFDDEVKVEYDKFKEKLQMTTNNPARLNLQSEFGSLVLENLITKYKNDIKKLTSISAAEIHNNQELELLVKMYSKHGIHPNKMLEQQLLYLAKMTNEAGHKGSSLFFSACFKYLHKESISLNEIIPQISSSLSINYYINYQYAFTEFSEIHEKMLQYWMDSQSDKMLDIIKAILNKPKTEHEIPIKNFLNNIPDILYKQFASVLEGLTPEEFIQVYMAAYEELQIELLSVIIFDTKQALNNLKKLSEAYKLSNFSPVFPKVITNQLQTMDPLLYKELEIGTLFENEQKDKLENDLNLLTKICANESLATNEKRSAIGKLTNLYESLRSKQENACTVTIKIFNSVSKDHWPDLFYYFNIHGSLKNNTHWIDYQEQLKNILHGTLEIILLKFCKEKVYNNYWDLAYLDEAFVAIASQLKDLPNAILKEFFFKNLPNSILIFKLFNELFKSSSHVSDYFVCGNVSDQIASWLPKNSKKRIKILAKMQEIDMGFEMGLRAPFVRNQNELAETVLTLINNRTEHVVALFNKYASNITSVILRVLNEVDPKGLIVLLQTAFSDLNQSKLAINLSTDTYMYLTLMLLSFSKNIDIDIHQIIDADPNHAHFLELLNNNWSNHSDYYELIFSILAHYHRDHHEYLQKSIFEYIKEKMDQNDLLEIALCMQAIRKVTDQQFEFLPHDKIVLIDYLTNRIPKNLNSDFYHKSILEVMAIYVPHFDRNFLMFLDKESIYQNELSIQHQKILNNLVRIYGFSHVNALCLELNLLKDGAYLIENFEKFPNILQKIDEASKCYNQFLNKFPYEVNYSMVWHFDELLRLAMMKTAKESKTTINCQINLMKISNEAGIPQNVAIQMPPLEISAPKVASLITANWEKSGIFIPKKTLNSEVKPKKNKRNCVIS